MILAAGLGTRIRSLESGLPKPLIPVGGRALIEYPLALLKKHGITEVVINLHYKGDKIKNALGDGSRFAMKIHYSEEEEILGTGGGIKKAEGLLGGAPFLVINSDVVAEVDLGDVIRFHERNRPSATLVLREDPDAETWGPVETNSSGRILRILGRPETGGEPGIQKMFTGIHVLDPRVLDYIPAGLPHHIIDSYIEMIRAGEDLMGYAYSGYWKDVGTPGRVQEAQSDLASGRIRLAGGEESRD
ncbi:MAG TPA: nucleotidyltransferase family protein [Nitrospiria bacterium]|nr:nucleotidyltransferase family protein [Nitrospiria bacterium]